MTTHPRYQFHLAAPQEGQKTMIISTTKEMRRRHRRRTMICRSGDNCVLYKQPNPKPAVVLVWDDGKGLVFVDTTAQPIVHVRIKQTLQDGFISAVTSHQNATNRVTVEQEGTTSPSGGPAFGVSASSPIDTFSKVWGRKMPR